MKKIIQLLEKILFIILLLCGIVAVYFMAMLSMMGNKRHPAPKKHQITLTQNTQIHQLHVPANSTITYFSPPKQTTNPEEAIQNHRVTQIQFHHPIQWQHHLVHEMAYPHFHNLYFNSGVNLVVRPHDFYIKQQGFQCVKDKRNGRLLFRYAHRADRFHSQKINSWQPEQYEFAGCEFADKILIKLENQHFYWDNLGILASDSHDPIRAHIHEKADGDSFYWLIGNTQSGAIFENEPFYLSHLYLNQQHEFQGLSGIFKQNHVYQNCTYGNLMTVNVHKIAPNQYQWTFGQDDDRPTSCDEFITNYQEVAQLLPTGSLNPTTEKSK